MGCDRISGLPDCLIAQILLSLTTKDSAKTSVLSTRWINVWYNVIGCDDRISTLLDSLLANILVYLPISDLVKTSVLSKRWEFLWLKVSGLDINVIDFLPYGKALARLMERFLEFNRGGSRLQKFKIKLANNDNACGNHINYIIRVMERIAELVHRGVEHLDVEIQMTRSQRQNVFNERRLRAIEFMPKYMYVSKTLVSLKLVNVGLEDTKFDVSLPCLKIMHLKMIGYKTNNAFVIIENLIFASPVLEDLTLVNSFDDFLETLSQDSEYLSLKD